MRSVHPATASPKAGSGQTGAASASKALWLLLLLLALAAGFAVSQVINFDDRRQLAVATEARAQAVETLALSSVAASVPGREAVRKVQAVAIIEARRMGLDISIASVGTGGRHRSGSSTDAQAFARLADRFPETIKAVEERDTFRERLSKSWISGSKALAGGASYNGSSQVISDAPSRVGACVVELHASGESLRAMLNMAYAESAIDAIERKARALGIAAADVAFLVAAHESSHCVLGMARRAGLLDTSWVDPELKVPPSWAESRSEDDHDSPALAKAEESAADMLSVFWAAEALGARKAWNLTRLVIYARSQGARLPTDDRLHDSSRSLTEFLALGQAGRLYSVAEPARFAWNTAVVETRVLIREAAAQRIASSPARRQSGAQIMSYWHCADARWSPGPRDPALVANTRLTHLCVVTGT